MSDVRTSQDCRNTCFHVIVCCRSHITMLMRLDYSRGRNVVKENTIFLKLDDVCVYSKYLVLTWSKQALFLYGILDTMNREW